MAIQIKTVTVWINAFIPRDIPGYSKPVPKGVHAGKTMIPGPNPLSDCFLTDQRGFSNSIHAKSRMHSEVTVSFVGPKPTITQAHRCDSTTEVDCEDGDVENTDTGSTSRMRFAVLPERVCVPGLIRISVDCAASNPCAPTSRAFGDIDYNGTLTISETTRTVEFVGKIDQFPGFEAYAAMNGGAGLTLFQASPPAGNTVMNLPGDANRSIKAKVIFP
jgi:hypothetical protein